jgi:CHAT domain-containing protein/cytochrome c-type biogenesis protein CcmH/NrfG
LWEARRNKASFVIFTGETVSEANAHLTLEEIFLVFRPQGGGVDGHSNQAVRNHLAHCAECAQVMDRYKGVMAKLNPFNRGGGTTINECPDPDVWVQVAAGLLPSDDALRHIEHAALCSACSAHLKEVLEIVGTNAPPELNLQQSLQTSSPAKQKRLAAEMAQRSRQVLQSEAAPSPIPFKKPSRTFRLPVWAYGAVAAVLALGVALAVFMRQGPGTTERLLAQAYAQQRTVELRIPGAGYGPIRVERGQKQSQMSSPAALLEAEATIKKGLEQHPDDPNLLRQKAEADLLNWDYQPAIETLGHALRIQPQSPKLLVDLATAHFERAEATDTPADYESALQSLGDALRLSPKDPAALFNQAIVHERLFLYSRAIADWELLLTVEGDAGWKQEAQKRLNDLRTKQQHHSARDAPDHLTPTEFKTSIETKTTLDPEQYIQLAERKILPGISHADIQDQNFQLAMLLAQYFDSAHSDRFFVDLLHSAGRPGFHEAVQLLSKASNANSAGYSEEAHSNAARSAQLFMHAGSTAGMLAAEFEEAYALQFESHANQCMATAAKAADGAQQRGYIWVEIQSLIEQAICSNMTGDLGRAKELAGQALRIAQERNYQSFYLRGLLVTAAMESEAGDELSAWTAIREGLERYWNGSLPAVRAYGFYTLLRLIGEYRGHWNVQFAAAYEALHLGADNPNRVVEAAEHTRLADAALHLGATKVAEEQFARAAQLFSAAPQTASVRWREIEAKIGLAKAQSLQSTRVQDIVRNLLVYLPEIKRLSNRYVESQYYTTLGEMKMTAGEPEAAQQFLGLAIDSADEGLRSLSKWQERVTWIGQKRQSYMLMVEALVRSGRPEAALKIWQHFLTAQPVSPLSANSRRSSRPSVLLADAPEQQQPASQTRILTYAVFSNSVTIWTRDGKQVHSVSVPVVSGDLRRTVENFISECSRPDSSLPLLRSDAQALYAWLIEPVRPWLPQNGHLIIEADGVLGLLPIEALIDKSGTYLGQQYTVTVAPGLMGEDNLKAAGSIHSSDSALIVAAPINSQGSLDPPPGALSEAREIAGQFSHATLLPGRKAKSATVQSEIAKSSVFHFAGHTALGRNGAAMLLADGSLSVGPAANSRHVSSPLAESHVLRNLKLAVFSACGTAKPTENSQVNSLVTEFLRAGVHDVVASRWNVDSIATEEFMTQFYRSVLAGNAVSNALQTVANGFRTTPRRTHPYYWAAFSAFGSA